MKFLKPNVSKFAVSISIFSGISNVLYFSVQIYRSFDNIAQCATIVDRFIRFWLCTVLSNAMEASCYTLWPYVLHGKFRNIWKMQTKSWHVIYNTAINSMCERELEQQTAFECVLWWNGLILFVWLSFFSFLFSSSFFRLYIFAFEGMSGSLFGLFVMLSIMQNFIGWRLFGES